MVDVNEKLDFKFFKTRYTYRPTLIGHMLSAVFERSDTFEPFKSDCFRSGRFDRTYSIGFRGLKPKKGILLYLCIRPNLDRFYTAGFSSEDHTGLTYSVLSFHFTINSIHFCSKYHNSLLSLGITSDYLTILIIIYLSTEDISSCKVVTMISST